MLPHWEKPTFSDTKSEWQGKELSSSSKANLLYLKLGGVMSLQQSELMLVPQWLFSSIKTVKTFLFRAFLMVFLVF